MTESQILYETEHFWVYENSKKKTPFEILLKGSVCSFIVGEKPSLDDAKKFIDKMERHPKNIKFLLSEK